MVDQKLINSINAHNSKFPKRILDAESLLNKRGIIMKEFIKDLQETLGTEADGVLGPSDKAQYDKIVFEYGKNYPILPIMRWPCGVKDIEGEM